MIRDDVVRFTISRAGVFDEHPTFAVCTHPVAASVAFTVDRTRSSCATDIGHGRVAQGSSRSTSPLASSLVTGIARHHVDHVNVESLNHTIFEGTSEIQQLVISRAISGLRIEWIGAGWSAVGIERAVVDGMHPQGLGKWLE